MCIRDRRALFLHTSYLTKPPWPAAQASVSTLTLTWTTDPNTLLLLVLNTWLATQLIWRYLIKYLLLVIVISVLCARALTLGLEPTYHTLYLPMHIHTYTCPSNPKVGKCTRWVFVLRARTNTNRPDHHTLCTGSRNLSWALGSVGRSCWCVRALNLLLYLHFLPYYYY